MNRVVKKNSDSNIFIEDKSNEDKSRDSQSFQGVPYLKRGDSSLYIEQFLGVEEAQVPPSPPKSELVGPVGRGVVH